MSPTTLSSSSRPPAKRTAKNPPPPSQPPNIWQLMNYPIPRGKCVHKPTLLTSTCPCLRFMLNPLQAASSFACDGCGHHASFHQLRGAEEPAAGMVVVGEKRGREVLEIEDEAVEGESRKRRN